MTMPWGSAEEPDDLLTELPTQPVHVVSSDARLSKAIGTEFGQWRTFLITNVVGTVSSTPGAVRLCTRSLRRRRLRIIVNSSQAGQSTQDGIIVGSSAFINSGIPMTPGNLGGGYLQIGDNVPYESQQELWAAYPTTNVGPVLVSVCDEVYASDPGEGRERET
jgi:hypothetical protein